MNYRNLRECVDDLEKNGHLVRIKEEVDPDLEMAAIHRKVNAKGGPALLFEKVKGSPFPAVSNLFGTIERARFIFRGTLGGVKSLVDAKSGPEKFLKKPLDALKVPFAAWKALPKKVRHADVTACETTLDQLPQIKSWKDDGGAFILLPQVFTENQDKPGIFGSNLGMYRIQISGNEYEKNKEIGLHYQIRRDIGIHHHTAIKRGEPLRVSIFVGGHPAHCFAAVMYLPEKLPEVAFAGALSGRRFRYKRENDFVLSADADFCITGYVDPKALKPEGPFGDHLGYYSLRHLFPYMKVEKVYHREGAIWPFTVVGRPPQEDSIFGALIQEIAGPILPQEIPGVKAVHAVDAAGVHPLLLAVGSERYMPYKEREPQEILTQANAILGYGPVSLAKYLWIAAREDNEEIDLHAMPEFFSHMLERVDWRRDLHFQTRTTMDTLDYSGGALNQGSKVVIAAAGKVKRELNNMVPEGLELPEGFSNACIVSPGIMAVTAPAFEDDSARAAAEIFTKDIKADDDFEGIALMILADDAGFVAENFKNFLWVTFTRSDPAADIYGIGSFTHMKHWGCEGPLVIDARLKPHHAPPVEEDPEVLKKIERLAQPGASLEGIL